MRPRVIPALLLDEQRLVKTRQFGEPQYVGDPLNTIRIFNDKAVDELVLVSRSAARRQRPIDLDFARELASEAFLPLGYGGGITTADQAEELVGAGFEKIVVGSGAHERPGLIGEIAERLGSQAVVCAIDVALDPSSRWRVTALAGSRHTGEDPVEVARRAADAGAGEVMLTATHREGTYLGYDIPLIEAVCAAVPIPVIAHGGARHLDDLVAASDAGADGVAAGSMFVFYGRHRAVMINFPYPDELDARFGPIS